MDNMPGHHTNLELATICGCIRVIKLLIDRGIDINVRDKQDMSILQNALLLKQKKLFLYLLALPNISLDGGRWGQGSLLTFAAQNGYTDVIKILIEKGVGVKTIGYKISTPLHAAATYGHKETMTYLLEQGMDVDIRAEADDGTSLLYASLSGQMEIVKLLLERGADINVKDHNGCSALANAINKENKEMLLLLLRHGAEINVSDLCWGNVVIYTARRGNYEIMKILLDHGANPRAKDGQGKTALDYAREQGDTNLIELLNVYKTKYKQ